MALDFLLEKASEHMEQAVRFEDEDDIRRARDHYLKASEYLFRAAKESSGEMKEIRMNNAEKLYQRAESIHIPTKKSISPGEKVQTTKERKEEEDLTEWIPTKKPDVTFDDVAGLENVKEEIRIKLIYPYAHPEKARHYGVGSGGGILLFGPPGTGKTYIAKATANEVDAMFFSIKPSKIMSQWVGVAEKNLAKLFSVARSYERSVIFIDEVEALIPRRSSNFSTVMKRVVPQILAEMDGIESNNENLLFIGATNEPWDIDHAALRPGRFDERIYVPPPDFQARRKMFERNLRNRPLADDVELDVLAELTKGYSGADIKQISIKASVHPFKESIEKGVERTIEIADFMKAIDVIKPSIFKKVLAKYESFRFDK